MAPDTKVPDGRTDSRMDRRTDNAKTITLRLWRGIKNTTFECNLNTTLQQHIIGTNLLTNVNKEKCPTPCGHVFKATKTIFELIQDIIGTNLLTNVNKPRPRGGHVFQPTGIIFELVQDIIMMNLLTKFHEDRTIKVAFRVKKCPAPWRPCFSCKHIINTNLLTIFHQDWTINVASRMLTRKNAPPPGGHVFQPTCIIFELIQDIIGMNLLTKKNAPPLGSHVFQAKVTIFKLIQDNSGTNLLSKFHEDRKINVASRVLTRKNAPPPGGHVF
ncbi:hypothetical protein DPMN_138311 [Dreissena polymorpha]|uniref:Uncharacterized protein n=1 Tax=Dreissena polymorpha TaxID=45954 RepID=A0A9D4JH61_DREPO|nr:hypothetical protein DPMN_138311 [Dreissena polymorpha]